jgi:glucosamine-6-phosphate deaminase
VKSQHSTLQANRRFFNEDEIMPQHAITLGFEDIMKAKKVILLATGPSKKEVIHRFLTEKKNNDSISDFIDEHAPRFDAYR